MTTLEIISKIKLLESELKLDKFKAQFEPSNFNSSDIIEVQKYARRIADYIGLEKNSFIVNYSKQKDNIGGFIELDNKSTSFIELNSNIMYRHEAVAYALCHEICHKYLISKGIMLSPTIENEYLTDITTLYLGLGKITLSGCKTHDKSTNITGNKTVETTHTHNLGYLTKDEFALAYLIICKTRQLSDNEINNGLNSEMRDRVWSKLNENKDLISSIDNGRTEYMQYEKQIIVPFKENLANFSLRIKIFEKIVNPYLNKLIHKTHESFHFLENIQTDEELESTSKTLININKLVRKIHLTEQSAVIEHNNQLIKKADYSIHQLFEEISDQIQNKISSNTKSDLLKFNCPSCNKDLRISKNTLAKITCTNCNYKFLVNTNPEDYKVYNINNSSISKIKKLFGLS